MDLFTPELFERLERFRLAIRTQTVGRQAGERRSARRGQSVEFADYRTYSPGDDPRHIDWNAYARMERLFLKLFYEEQETTLTILVDTSGSMAWGDKDRLSLQLAGALAYLALMGFDRTTLGLIGGGRPDFFGPVQGRASLHRLLNKLSTSEAQGQADLANGLRSLGSRRPTPGKCVVISDCLQPLGFLEGLGYLQAARQEVTLVQVLAPDEREPTLEGDLRLIDQENSAPLDVTIDLQSLARYKARLQEHQQAIADYCGRRAIGYVELSSALPVDQFIQQALVEGGLAWV